MNRHAVPEPIGTSSETLSTMYLRRQPRRLIASGPTLRRADAIYFARQSAATALARIKVAPAIGRIFLAAAVNRLRGATERPDIIFHAGEHKTGTTSIQSLLLRERKRLLAQGLHVLRTGQGVDGAHHRLVYTLTGRAPSRSRANLLRAELAQTGGRTVLISSEAAKQAIVEDRGERLIDELRAAGAARVRILLWVRSPFGLANSSYSSHTSRLELAGARFDDFLPAHAAGPAYRYDRFVELARRDDVDLIVRPYSSSARHSAARDFAAALGLDFGSGGEPRHNSSFGPVGLEAIRTIVEETGPLPLERRRRLWPPLRLIARELNEQPFWGIDAAREAALATADRRTEEFAQAVWGQSWRDVIGEERRPLNIFDPADRAHRALLDSTIAQMRRVRAEILR